MVKVNSFTNGGFVFVKSLGNGSFGGAIGNAGENDVPSFKSQVGKKFGFCICDLTFPTVVV